MDTKGLTNLVDLLELSGEVKPSSLVPPTQSGFANLALHNTAVSQLRADLGSVLNLFRKLETESDSYVRALREQEAWMEDRIQEINNRSARGDSPEITFGTDTALPVLGSVPIPPVFKQEMPGWGDVLLRVGPWKLISSWADDSPLGAQVAARWRYDYQRYVPISELKFTTGASIVSFYRVVTNRVTAATNITIDLETPVDVDADSCIIDVIHGPHQGQWFAGNVSGQRIAHTCPLTLDKGEEVTIAIPATVYDLGRAMYEVEECGRPVWGKTFDVVLGEDTSRAWLGLPSPDFMFKVYSPTGTLISNPGPEPASVVMLQATDTTPKGSSISYSLVTDTDTRHATSISERIKTLSGVKPKTVVQQTMQQVVSLPAKSKLPVFGTLSTPESFMAGTGLSAGFANHPALPIGPGPASFSLPSAYYTSLTLKNPLINQLYALQQQAATQETAQTTMPVVQIVTYDTPMEHADVPVRVNLPAGRRETALTVGTPVVTRDVIPLVRYREEVTQDRFLRAGLTWSPVVDMKTIREHGVGFNPNWGGEKNAASLFESFGAGDRTTPLSARWNVLGTAIVTGFGSLPVAGDIAGYYKATPSSATQYCLELAGGAGAYIRSTSAQPYAVSYLWSQRLIQDGAVPQAYGFEALATGTDCVEVALRRDPDGKAIVFRCSTGDYAAIGSSTLYTGFYTQVSDGTPATIAGSTAATTIYGKSSLGGGLLPVSIACTSVVLQAALGTTSTSFDESNAGWMLFEVDIYSNPGGGGLGVCSVWNIFDHSTLDVTASISYSFSWTTALPRGGGLSFNNRYTNTLLDLDSVSCFSSSPDVAPVRLTAIKDGKVIPPDTRGTDVQSLTPEYISEIVSPDDSGWYRLQAEPVRMATPGGQIDLIVYSLNDDGTRGGVISARDPDFGTGRIIVNGKMLRVLGLARSASVEVQYWGIRGISGAVPFTTNRTDYLGAGRTSSLRPYNVSLEDQDFYPVVEYLHRGKYLYLPDEYERLTADYVTYASSMMLQARLERGQNPSRSPRITTAYWELS